MIILPQDDHLLTAAEAAEWDRKMAVDDAYRRGAARMRERCAYIADVVDKDLGKVLRAIVLALPTDGAT